MAKRNKKPYRTVDRRKIARQKNRQRRQAQNQLKLEQAIERREAKQLEKYLRNYHEPTATPIRNFTPAEEVNAALDYASLNREYLQEYALAITPILKQLVGSISYMPKAGDVNEFFEIDKDYSGDLRQLFAHVKFKDLPKTNTTQQFIENILEQPWSTPEALEEYEQEWRNKSYLTNLKDERLADISLEMKENLENIMNTSAAWELAKKGAPNSEQVQANWIDIYHQLDRTRTLSDKSLFDEVVRRITNSDGTTNSLTSYVDEAIIKLMK